MKYDIQKAAYEDLDRICDIYAYARRFMADHGNPSQWGNSKPQRSELIADIQNGNLYIIKDRDKICGVFAFILGEDPTYREIYDGNWHHHCPYGTIHRVAGDGSGGIFRACVNYCQEHISCLRIDTHHDNYVMQNAVVKAGFEKCGIIFIADGSPRIAYDRYV